MLGGLNESSKGQAKKEDRNEKERKKKGEKTEEESRYRAVIVPDTGK